MFKLVQADCFWQMCLFEFDAGDTFQKSGDSGNKILGKEEQKNNKLYQFEHNTFLRIVFSWIEVEMDLQIIVFCFYLHNVPTSLELGIVHLMM